MKRFRLYVKGKYCYFPLETVSGGFHNKESHGKTG